MNADVIKLLPDSVANQIAAGEVIQRPASVIKELVENAIDAGAHSIDIILKDAGRTLIQVVDDGCGMSPSDARMAFERHATSKISSATDLYSLTTMGFRGEALPSIAAVAQVDMRTMRREDSIGCRLKISESQFESLEPAACTPGTNLMVKNLFFHMPARRKFLKKDPVELGHILREFERLALVNTQVDFTLMHNDNTLHKFLRGSLKQRIADLFGKHLVTQLAPVSTETGLVRISGFTSMPSAARKRGYQQFFFVNGRNMRHPLFHRAVLSCYDRLIPSDAQPSYFINFEVDPATIDVNIHPQKHEIKFENEQAIYQILVAAVRETFGKIQAAGALDFNTEDAPVIPIFDPAKTAGGTVPPDEIEDNFNPFAGPAENTAGSGGRDYAAPVTFRPAAVPRDWDKLYENFDRRRAESLAELRSSALNGEDSPAVPHEGPDAPDRLFTADSSLSAPTGTMQVRGSFIVTPSAGGLTVIDQHRAHVRVLFERFMDTLGKDAIASQQVIFPETVTLSPAQQAVLEQTAELLPRLGFELTFLGDATWAINGQPALPASSASPSQMLLSVLDEVEQSGATDAAELMQPLALGMARSAAIRNGRQLSPAEMDSLVADLFRSSTPELTPDGLPVIATLSEDDLRALF